LQLVDKKTLCGLIPHAGDMCLLDAVVHWDEDSIHCLGRSHRDSNNPLRTEQGLAAINGVEYGAQAMAVHGGLLAGGQVPPGYLASVRHVVVTVSALDKIKSDLHIRAYRLSAENGNFMYTFTIETENGEPILSARALVAAL